MSKEIDFTEELFFPQNIFPQNEAITEVTGVVCDKPEMDKVILCDNNHILFQLALKRRYPSSKVDYILVSADKSMLKNMDIRFGTRLTMKGIYRAFRYYGVDNKWHVIMYFHPEEITDGTSDSDKNIIYGVAYIEDKLELRTTPITHKKIMDIKLSIPRKNGGKDILNAISWGKVAERINKMNYGQKIHFQGRIQSRDYNKDGDTKTVNEISIMKAAIIL